MTILGQLRGSAKLARLLCREIKATELKERAMMAEAAQVASFGRMIRAGMAKARDLLQEPEVGVGLQVNHGSLLELIVQLA